MRKTILFIFALFLIIGGLLQNMKVRALLSGVPVSESYLNINNCIQDSMAFSIGLFFGLPFLLMPKKTIEWFIEPLSPRYKEYILKKFKYGAIRLFGFILILSVCLAIPASSCFSVLGHLFSK